MNDLQAANQQLKTDIEKEQELERQRVDFFSAASHELKTPLTILKGHLAGMLNGVSGYENHIEYMERSLAVVDRMENSELRLPIYFELPVPSVLVPHLFEAFYRADTSRNRNTGGTGLGLYIVRKVMEMHRANYGISNINNGVLFWFELPCKQPVDNSI